MAENQEREFITLEFDDGIEEECEIMWVFLRRTARSTLR